MNTAVRIDPETGLKVFNTRAAKASEKITGKGYSVVTDQKLTELPKMPAGATFNAEEQAKYLAFKEARRGAADYMTMEGGFKKYLDDVYSEPAIPREALDDECDILVVGGGFGGLLLWHKLNEAGFTDVRFCEKGGDVGGTWYWNRYPGIACDVESYSYLPLLEETGYIPSMKFASGFEILEHCQRMAEKFGFYDHCLFHTTVEATTWDEASGRWIVQTDRGDKMRARFVVLANGILTTPKLARIAGMEKFEGESFHTSRWDYNIDLRGKTVGIIGTGATAVQAVPELAKIVGQLYVFQRTPSSIDVRDQRETTEEERATWAKERGWAQARRARFARISEVRAAVLANDDYLAGKIQDFKERKKHDRQLTREELMEKQLDSSFRLMEQVQAPGSGRDRQRPEDGGGAETVLPVWLQAKPTFHDEYLRKRSSLPQVHLVDAAPRGVNEINERGVVHEGVEYPLDVLIYATGFQWMGTSTFNRITGRGGRTLKDKWETEGTRTFLGLHNRGFPNLFIVTGPQGGGGSFNFTDVIYAHADYLVWVLQTMRERGARIVDVRKEPEDKYAEHCREVDIATAPLRDCISYYNGEGKAAPGSLAYYGGRQWDKYRIEAQSTLEPSALFGEDSN